MELAPKYKPLELKLEEPEEEEEATSAPARNKMTPAQRRARKSGNKLARKARKLNGKRRRP